MTCLSQTQGTPAQPGVKKPVKITPKRWPLTRKERETLKRGPA